MKLLLYIYIFVTTLEKTGQFSKQRIFSVVILIAETSNKGQQVATEGYIKLYRVRLSYLERETSETGNAEMYVYHRREFALIFTVAR